MVGVEAVENREQPRSTRALPHLAGHVVSAVASQMPASGAHLAAVETATSAIHAIVTNVVSLVAVRLLRRRVVGLRGAGEVAFVSGADISEFENRRSGGDGAAEYDRVSARAFGALNAIEKPVIALIHD